MKCFRKKTCYWGSPGHAEGCCPGVQPTRVLSKCPPKGDTSQPPLGYSTNLHVCFFLNICSVAWYTRTHAEIKERDVFQRCNEERRSGKRKYLNRPLPGHRKLLKVGPDGDKQKCLMAQPGSRWPARVFR